MRIAVADDEEYLLKHLEITVSEVLPDAEVFAFSSPSLLLETAKHTKFDIVFLDIQMPGFTGLELAKELNNINDKLNIIFATGYDYYKSDAIDLFASGYITKPVTKAKIEEQIKHLRYNIIPAKRVYAQTFGNFTLFIDGKPISFPREKVQMAIAYLIHRRGSLVNKKELSSVLFDDGVYDANRRSYMSKICSEIEKVFESYNLTGLINKNSRDLSINAQLIDCDLYDYLDHKPGAKDKYKGEYMNQYSFGEEIIGLLED